jgi:hypothetical protein
VIGRTGALRIMRDGDLVHRLRPVENRNLVGIQASSERFAFITSVMRRTRRELDRVQVPRARRVDGDRVAMGSPCGIALHGPDGTMMLDVGDVHDVAAPAGKRMRIVVREL